MKANDGINIAAVSYESTDDGSISNISNGSNTPSTTTISYTEYSLIKKKNVKLKAFCKENNLRIGGKKRSN